MDKGVARGVVTREAKEDTLARISLVGTLEEAVEGCRIVIEAVPEDQQVKRDVFERLDKLAPTDAILASNTSALSITMIASWTDRRGPRDRPPFLQPA